MLLTLSENFTMNNAKEKLMKMSTLLNEFFFSFSSHSTVALLLYQEAACYAKANETFTLLSVA